MPEFYPAIQARMCDWKYYIVKMTMKEININHDSGKKKTKMELYSDSLKKLS